MTNPYEHDDCDGQDHEADDRFLCDGGCGSWLLDGDPSNVRLDSTRVLCADCASKHPVIVGDVAAALKADEQQDEFNRTRR